ncbi:hypothetical protein ACFYXF_33130 [Streptomyces sp. NPDC002680]|uniref:hypothetical protein n=1 Tax=Streptomyces sp. NPDC002680 TaxID=3364659 RepID=UPI0036A1516B
MSSRNSLTATTSILSLFRGGGRREHDYWLISAQHAELNREDVRWPDGREINHRTPWEKGRYRVISQPPTPDVTVVSIGRLHDGKDSEYADVLEHATVAIDLRRHWRAPYLLAGRAGWRSPTRRCGEGGQHGHQPADRRDGDHPEARVDHLLAAPGRS